MDGAAVGDGAVFRLRYVAGRSRVGAVCNHRDMEEAFTIMQIGDPAMDRVYDEAIDPAIRQAGLDPRRVDRHNEGDLLKGEIVKFIETSQVIVADVTNERPNCYLEVGYAMGLGKKKNLILTAREDHHHSSPNFQRVGPKVHFDLEGYSIIFWDPKDLPAFKEELARVITRRAAIVRPEPGAVAVERPSDWSLDLRALAETGIAGVGRRGYMEVVAEVGLAENWSQQELLEALRESSIHTFGWPIAVMLENRPECRPRPTTDGILAEIAIGGEESRNPFGQDRRSYDFWKLFRDGRFYTLLSLFEDERADEAIFFEVRIRRVTETLLLLARLYRRLGFAETDLVRITIRHQGLAGRTLRAANPERDLWERETREEAVETTISASLAELERDLTAYVKQIIDPLFMVFDFFELGEPILEELVDEFVSGRVR